MMRKPMRRDGEDAPEDQTGPRAVQEFDPELGDKGKPDWMESVILEPVESILKWIDRKTDEIYRVAHLSGVHGQRKSNNEVASGLAMRYEFQQLTSVLGKKSHSMCEAEKQIVRFWLMWQNKFDLFKEIKITRSKSFSVDDLSISLDNLIKSMKEVISKTFRQEAQIAMTRMTLPDLKDSIRVQIESEIQSPNNII